MTREEAIEIIKFEMAIKALGNSLDCISRQAVNKLVDEKANILEIWTR